MRKIHIEANVAATSNTYSKLKLCDAAAHAQCYVSGSAAATKSNLTFGIKV